MILFIRIVKSAFGDRVVSNHTHISIIKYIFISTYIHIYIHTVCVTLYIHTRRLRVARRGKRVFVGRVVLLPRLIGSYSLKSPRRRKHRRRRRPSSNLTRANLIILSTRQVRDVEWRGTRRYTHTRVRQTNLTR